MTYLRPSQPSDLDSIIAFAEEASLGITSLPQNPDFHEKRLIASQTPEKTGIHLFSLVSEDKVIGISGFFRHSKRTAPTRVYEKRSIDLVQPKVHVKRQMMTLDLATIPAPFTEIGSLFLSKNYRGKHLGPLLSLSRFLYMASFPKLHDPLVYASLRGVSDDEGNCPFWNAVGAHFYGHDFRQANYFRADHADEMTALFPRTPLYVSLLPYSAQHVIGKTHPNTEGAKKILLSQGFSICNYLDLFDAGPYLLAKTSAVSAYCKSIVAKVGAIQNKIETPNPVLLATVNAPFRATLSHILGGNGVIVINKACADILQVKVSDPIRYLAMRGF